MFKLTDRRRQVLHWAALGKSNEEIGAILGISRYTVKNHMSALCDHFKVESGVSHTSRTQCVVMGLLTGLISLEELRHDLKGVLDD
jgi:DNA-binding NarL/FixJ family response regulator